MKASKFTDAQTRYIDSDFTPLIGHLTVPSFGYGLHMQPCLVANSGCPSGVKNRRRAQGHSPEPRETVYYLRSAVRAEP